jgi:hypothetical protein
MRGAVCGPCQAFANLLEALVGIESFLMKRFMEDGHA